MSDYKIVVPKPCSQHWDKMTPTGEGKYCGACQKIVVDFSTMTAEQIQTYFLENQGKKTCGHFKTIQLGNSPSKLHQLLLEAQARMEQAFTGKISRHVALLVLGVLMALVGCQSRTTGVPLAAEDCTKAVTEEHLTGDTLYVAPPDTTNIIRTNNAP